MRHNVNLISLRGVFSFSICSTESTRAKNVRDSLLHLHLVSSHMASRPHKPFPCPYRRRHMHLLRLAHWRVQDQVRLVATTNPHGPRHLREASTHPVETRPSHYRLPRVPAKMLAQLRHHGRLQARPLHRQERRRIMLRTFAVSFLVWWRSVFMFKFV